MTLGPARRRACYCEPSYFEGYLNYDNLSFAIEDGDLVTFQTDDIFGYVDADRLIWKGRKDDYIQV